VGFISCASLDAGSVIIVVLFLLCFLPFAVAFAFAVISFFFLGSKFSHVGLNCLFIFKILNSLHRFFVSNSELWPQQCVSAVSTLRFYQCPLSVAICSASTWRRHDVDSLWPPSACYMSHVAWTLSGNCSFSYLTVPHTQSPHKDLCLRFYAISQVSWSQFKSSKVDWD